MRAKVIFYHNSHCSKSRQTLQLLHDKGIKPEIIDYLIYPPSKAQLKNILHLLGMAPRDLMRTKDPSYKELVLDNTELSEDELITAMTEHPSLIERPIVLANGTAAVGRPPENVLEIL